ncbi:MAG: hypothetical protein AUH12_04800 [Gemmatimonadetes bacterium 13_2_20CM_69_8]|nr:MAG: hypothetical protein AUH12_04800 [Gemmatimonadetes bacterium 13_2_20CM_69_8]
MCRGDLRPRDCRSDGTDDPEQFVLALAELLADPPRRVALGNAARARAVKLFALDRMGREYAEALEAAAS